MSEHEKHTHADDIGCIEAIEGLYALLDGELNDSETKARIEEHVSHCRSCYSRAEVERLLTERLKAAAEKSDAERSSETLKTRLGELIERF